MPDESKAYAREWSVDKSYTGSSVSCDTKHKIRIGLGYDSEGYKTDLIAGIDVYEDTADYWSDAGWERKSQGSHKIRVVIYKDGDEIIEQIQPGSLSNDGWAYFYYRINSAGKYKVEVHRRAWAGCAKPSDYSPSAEWTITEADLEGRAASSGLDNRTEYEKHEQAKDDASEGAKSLISMAGFILIPLALIITFIRLRRI
tara:strand:+ start:57 stop:656 length:600 start_codon:yes stop_codon:yes gene_type:complete